MGCRRSRCQAQPVVDASPRLVEPVVGAVVQATERGSHPPALLGGVVVDDVEDDLDAFPVQQFDHALELVEGAFAVLGAAAYLAWGAKKPTVL